MEFLVDINSVNSQQVQLQIYPGELVYCVSNKNSASLLKGIVAQEDVSISGTVLGCDMSSDKASPIQSLRSQIGYVDKDMYLSREHTISDNFEMYATGFKDKDVMKTRFEKHLTHFNLDLSTKVSILNPREMFFTRLCICLAKNPKLVVVPEVFTFSSQTLFKQQMSYIYELIMEGGLTYVAAVHNASMTDSFPGRVVTL